MPYCRHTYESDGLKACTRNTVVLCKECYLVLQANKIYDTETFKNAQSSNIWKFLIAVQTLHDCWEGLLSETYNAVFKPHEELLLKHSVFVKISTGQGSHWPQFCLSIPEAPLHEKMRHPIKKGISFPATRQEFLPQLVYTSSCMLGFQSVGWRSASCHHPSTLPPLYSRVDCCLTAPVTASPKLCNSIPATGKVPYLNCPTTLAARLLTEALTPLRPHWPENTAKWPSCK